MKHQKDATRLYSLGHLSTPVQPASLPLTRPPASSITWTNSVFTDVYASPFLMARPGSVHGYDVTDQTRFNPEIGDEDSFVRLSDRAAAPQDGTDRRRGAQSYVHHSSLQSLVVGCAGERTQQSVRAVLRYRLASAERRAGQQSSAPFPRRSVRSRARESGDQGGLRSRTSSRRSITTTRLPLAPWTWTMILEPAAASLRDQLGPSHEHVAELESITTALSHLPGNTETDEAKIRERRSGEGHRQAPACSAHGDEPRSERGYSRRAGRDQRPPRAIHTVSIDWSGCSKAKRIA